MARGDDPLHVWQIPDGRWRGQVTDGFLPSGRLRRRYVHGKTKDEARDAKKKLLRQVAKGEAISGKITVKGWADQWLPIQRHRLRPNTYVDYRTAVTKWIVPTIGGRRLSLLTPADVRLVGDAVRKAGHTSTTAALRQTILTKMLRDAVQEGHDVPARVLAVKRPAKAVHDRDATDLGHAITMLKTSIDSPQPGRWIAGFLQGMRQGECLGLMWDAVDLDHGIIDVSWQLDTLPSEHGCGKPARRAWPCGYKRAGSCPSRIFITPDGYEVRQLNGAAHLTRPKTARGQRLIPIVPPMAAALAALPHRSGLVWPGVDGKPQSDHADITAWRALQDAAKVRHSSGRYYTVHEMRHTTATLLMSLGVDETVRTAILGHSSITVTRGYQHADMTQARAALEAAAVRLGLS